MGILVALHSNIIEDFKVSRQSIMPVRLLSSRVLKWPDRGFVITAVQEWVERQVILHPELRGVGYFGSYARGDWGVGSDLDLLIIVDHVDQETMERALGWDTVNLPVPVDVFVYSAAEWEKRCQEQSFFRQVRKEVVWVYSRYED